MQNKSSLPVNKRQQDIIDYARDNGFVTVENLSEKFQVTHQTIRRDLTFLSDNFYLSRTHGGAFFQSGVSNVNHFSRQTIAQSEKIAIAEKVSEIVSDNSSIVLNIGTTTEQVAKTLMGKRKGLKIITNNINIVNIVSHSPHSEVWVAGGRLRSADNAVIGSVASDFIKNFKIDYAIVGVSAIDKEGTLLDFDHDELMVTKSIYAQSRKIILIADANKFERKAPYVTAHIKDVDIFVTDKKPSKDIIKICKQNNVELIISPPNS